MTILEDQQGDETITERSYGDDEKQYQKNFAMEILKCLGDSSDVTKTLSILTEEYISVIYNEK